MDHGGDDRKQAAADRKQAAAGSVVRPGHHPSPDDTRGIVDPAAMFDVVAFDRYPPGPDLDGLIDWFWSVRYSLPPGRVHDQQVLNHPCGHISVGTLDDAGVPLDPPQGRVYGVLDRVSVRRLTLDGWTVAAKTTVGGLGVFVDRPAREVAGRQLTFADALPGVDGKLVGQVAAATGDGATDLGGAVECLRDGLRNVIAQRSSDRVAEARWVAEVVKLAETDRTIGKVDQLAEAASVSVRSLQRLFDDHVGTSPSFVIRRWRIIEAVDAARAAADDSSGSGAGEAAEWRGWADVAARVGYADQAHLARDIRRHLGITPSEYLRSFTRTSAGETR